MPGQVTHLPPKIDLYSDTVTRPSIEMRKAMMEAEVGNEQAFEDPTVNLLNDMVAELTGKEAAVYLPSGTMCNEIAFRVHCRQGDEIILDKTSHPLHWEAGGPAALSGAMCRPVEGPRGIFTAAQVHESVRPKNKLMPRSALVSMENTAGGAGGTVWPVERVAEVADAARAHKLAVHMDGARLLNAVVASGTPASAYGNLVDSLWIDLSKGLGCPVGAVLAGSKEFIAEAWRFKHQFGGAMRQAGIIAAAGVYALRHNIERLAEDHDNAKLLAEGLAQIKGVEIDPRAVETNIVFFGVSGTGLSTADFSARLLSEHGIRIGAASPRAMRALTHLDVSRANIETTLRAIEKLVTQASKLA